MEKSGPLKGVKVLEIAGIGPAPFGCMMLSDLGADVLRVDRPTGGLKITDQRFDVLARGRSNVTADLKSADGVALVHRLIKGADVLVEPFRPGVAERLGIGPEECLATNPALVYARMTGWGQTGPLAPRVGHDIDYSAIAGSLGTTGEFGRKPVPALNLVADFGGGGMFLVTGVIAALFERVTSGLGQVIDVSMVDGTATLLAMTYGFAASGAFKMARGSNLLDGGTPFYDTYECADGEYVAVGCLEPQFFAEMVRVLDIADSITGQQDRDNYPQMRELLSTTFKSKTRDEWASLFDGVDACVSPVLRLDEVAKDPHMAARGILVDINGVPQPSPAPRFSRTPGAIGAAPGTVQLTADEACEGWGV